MLKQLPVVLVVGVCLLATNANSTGKAGVSSNDNSVIVQETSRIAVTQLELPVLTSTRQLKPLPVQMNTSRATPLPVPERRLLPEPKVEVLVVRPTITNTLRSHNIIIANDPSNRFDMFVHLIIHK